MNTFLTTVLFVFKVHNEFILPSETEGFIHRMGDIIKRAKALMAKEQQVQASGSHRLPQPAFHNGVNLLSSSQVSVCSFTPSWEQSSGGLILLSSSVSLI